MATLEPPPVAVPVTAVGPGAAATAVDPASDAASVASVASVPSTNPYDDHTDAAEDPAPEHPLRLPRRGVCGFCRESEEERYERVLGATALTRMQKNSIRRRYFELLRDFRVRCRIYSLLFHIGHFTITVGSLVVPALLSVQYAGTGITFIDASSFQAQIYWLTWILSLLVTMFNGILVLFKVDMKYYFLHTTLERLRSEGWQYLELTGRYAGGLMQAGDTPSHRNQYKYFCHYIEKIKLKQVEEEYYKYEDSQKNATANATAVGATANATGGAPSATGAAASATGPSAVAATAVGAAATAVGTQEQKRDLPLYPPSIDKNLSSLTEQAPPSVQEAIRGIVKSQKSIASMQPLLQQQPQNTVIVPAAESFAPSAQVAAPSRVVDAQAPLPVLSAVRRTSA